MEIFKLKRSRTVDKINSSILSPIISSHLCITFCNGSNKDFGSSTIPYLTPFAGASATAKTLSFLFTISPTTHFTVSEPTSKQAIILRIFITPYYTVLIIQKND